MRSGLLRTVQFPDALTNQFQRNVALALDTLSADDDILKAPVVSLAASGQIAPGKSVVVYRGAPGATLALSLASAQGPSVAAVVLVANESTGALSLTASGGDTINGGKSASVAAGDMAILLSDGVSSWLSLSTDVTAPVLIDSATLSFVASYTSPTFAAETYSKIWMEISGFESSATFEPVLTLGGLTTVSGGTSNSVYVSAAAQAVTSSGASTICAILDSAGGNIDVEGLVEIFPLTTGRKRHYLYRWSSSGAIGYTHGSGRNSDTTHGVTSVGWTGSSAFSGTVRVWGTPA